MTPLQAILKAIGVRLQTLAGLRVFDYMPDAIAPPTAIIQLPRSINFDLTWGRGADSYVIPVLLLVGKASDRAGSTNLASYLNAAGSTSVKAAVEADATLGGLVDDCRVTAANGIGSYTFGAVEYLGCSFDLAVVA